jgi:ABC-type antimicrobial peptide transport system permease subunit
VRKTTRHRPPEWAQRFLRWYCREQVLEDLEGDLNEVFEKNLKLRGGFKAKLIYSIDVIKFMRWYTIKKLRPATTMRELIVFRNYFKTSFRNIARNRLFSTINITGLAVSMSLGLLLISLLIELKSFDKFHANAHRIYRVNNLLRSNDGSTHNYATTSILTGKKIKETVTGIERVVTMQRGFNKDIRLADKVIPMQGFWASESFFEIFSFPLISGNASTALKEPNSLVLTKTSAIKLFGDVDATGKAVQIDSVDFIVTGVVEDPPINSHMKFEMLGSFITLDARNSITQKGWLAWDNMWDNYVYILPSKESDLVSIKKSLSRISDEGNKTVQDNHLSLYLEPLREIALSRNMSNSIGPTVDKSAIVTLGILAFVVIVSACFNYTNLSIARALRRTKEVGIRKVIGASRRQVFNQFVFESLLLAFISLIVSYFIFLIIRSEFLSMSQRFKEMVTLEPAFETYLYFIGFAIATGIFAGVLPAAFFSKINAARVLKDFSSVKLFGYINVRKALITFQYTLSILFIVAATIGYKQYRYSLNFDLGFKTENIFVLDLQGNKPDHLLKELSELPEIKQVAQSDRISSIGANNVADVHIKYKNTIDSTTIYYNFIDADYIKLHDHKLVAGENFKPTSSKEQSSIIINERTVKWMQLADPREAIGEELTIDRQRCTVVGVIKDFHHERVNYPIQNFAFRYDPTRFQVISLELESSNMLATIDKIKAVWKKFDTTHSFAGKFYQDHIHQAYDKLSWIIKIVGFIAFLAIFIASMGLLGMIIFTTERRLKEISIRKVLGATESGLVYLMSKGFLTLLIISSIIATPCAYYFMDRVVFGKLPYRAPIEALDLLMGTLIVMTIAAFMVGTQTLKTAKSNPADILKSE